jgi:hypothetical protein
VSKPVDLTDLLIRIRAMLECRAINDPAERLTHYHLEIVHEAASASSHLDPPAGNR